MIDVLKRDKNIHKENSMCDNKCRDLSDVPLSQGTARTTGNHKKIRKRYRIDSS
jgi:hypothetical protein